MGALLAVDIGLRTGLAFYGADGRLVWYRSHNFGSASRLKRGAHSLLREMPGLSHVILEGGGPLADIWEKESVKQGLEVMQIPAEKWRKKLLYSRHQRTGFQAKRTADGLARLVIEWADAPRPTSLRHDAAEAILVGLWAVLELGWLKNAPDILKG